MEQTAQRNRAEWFFSEDGHRAYASSGTTGEKTRYFFEYLRGLGQKTPDRVLYALAYIMADGMDADGGRFAGWPAILQGSVNPFIKLVVDGTLQPAEEMERSLSTGWGFSRGVTKQEEDGCRWWITDQLLCALHGITPCRRVAYEELQDSSAEDCDLYLYRIERQIIWLLGGDALMSPYSLRALFCEPFREQQADLGCLHDDLLRGNLQFAAEKNGDITAKTRRDTPDKQQMSAGRVIVTLLLVLLACFAIGKALSIYAVNSAPEPGYGQRLGLPARHAGRLGEPKGEGVGAFYLSRRGHIGRRAVRYLEKRTKSLLLLLRDKRRTTSGVGDPAQHIQHHAVERVTLLSQHIRKSRRNYEYLR